MSHDRHCTVVAFPLTGNEIAAHAALLRESDLPAGDLEEPGRALWSFQTTAGEVVGYGGLEQYGTDALLRSIVILHLHRGHGLGTAIVHRLLDIAREAGVQDIYLLTTTARPFFERAGFVAVERHAAPSAIRATEQVARLCPASAPLLHRTVMPIDISPSP